MQFLLRRAFLSICLGALATVPAIAEDSSAGKPVAVEGVQSLVAKVQPSVVVVTVGDRDGRTLGVGSGVIVREDGLIATNLHVLGEGRPLTVRLFDKREFPVTQIYAHEKSQDLALIRIEADKLPALELGDSDELQQGQPTVAFGNPQGLEHSVVTGVVSALRSDVDGMNMIQLAIPIERGNSGGPVVDSDGKVVGLLTLKSLVTENLGYAVAINSLKPLLEKPNPIAMGKWLTIGALNPRHWQVVGDARWTQHAGRLRADGPGKGFGGRSLCLSTQSVPETPFEVAVQVRLREQDGAAGLVFHADGGDRHYGFYPTSGKLRVSRFDGPVVYDWHVLWEEQRAEYSPDAWNELKIRVEKDRIQCLCNGVVVYELEDDFYRKGKVGLAKFRHTTAEFKNFRLAERIEVTQIDDATRSMISEIVNDIGDSPAPNPSQVGRISEKPVAQFAAVKEAERLEKQAAWLRRLAREAYEASVREKIVAALKPASGEPDLLAAVLWIAALDNEELDVEFYKGEIDALATELKSRLNETMNDRERFEELRKLLFEDSGFHGSRANYHSASNSHLNEVIDDREGLPITLSVVTMEVARRVGLKVEGVGLPGHFIVRLVPSEGEPQLFDVFDGAKPLTRAEAFARVDRGEPDEEWLKAVDASAICARILRNLLSTLNIQETPETALRYIETIVALDADSISERLLRAVLNYDLHRIEQGLEDVDWVLKQRPAGVDLDRVRQLKEALQLRAKP
ncbi:Putative serine protease HtrA [Caulifigura coniformis]|uniref:Serine protease HtrA n=1 Tax=Caulifigura coniformis TaxID=2527983 RepID=A0A517SCG2_9PLAN|nr:tetratricopeptide repeat protein [Caulifigura coniformis]QDT53803.1 Putative serine protease HtrA [Caulifigura coniformis]